jgi:hypothetical protein
LNSSLTSKLEEKEWPEAKETVEAETVFGSLVEPVLSFQKMHVSDAWLEQSCAVVLGHQDLPKGEMTGYLLHIPSKKS